MPRFDQATSKCQYRRVVNNSDTRRRAGIAADQASKNGLRFFCGLYDSDRA